MKLYAYIEPSHFKAYLREHNLKETEESRSLFLRDVGTVAIVCNTVKVGFVEVGPGSCIRLVSPKSKESAPVAPSVVAVNASVKSLPFWCGKWAWYS
jgi:hypothetical protein